MDINQRMTLFNEVHGTMIRIANDIGLDLSNTLFRCDRENFMLDLDAVDQNKFNGEVLDKFIEAYNKTDREKYCGFQLDVNYILNGRGINTALIIQDNKLVREKGNKAYTMYNKTNLMDRTISEISKEDKEFVRGE